MFRLFTELATVSRIIYNNNKSSFTLTWNSYKWHIKPLKPTDSLYQGAFWKDFSFTTNINADIQEGDELEFTAWPFIWKYTVKWIVPNAGLVVKYKRLLLLKS